ncbi:MAG TPA: dienelactone hydrolase family protein [Candidatus Bathyarchaeia archaeon]|nr:dienelactone hydrolase family protein [Candidatus Bathyarchaeia archaeon]
MPKERLAENAVRIPVEGKTIDGNLAVPRGARSVVVFAHGSGSSRFSPRNTRVARAINEAGLATFLIDLLTGDEEVVDVVTAQFRFDIELLARRLMNTTEWLTKNVVTKDLTVGYFGASTGAAAALIAAAKRPDDVKAVVSRGGRPDLALKYLAKVKAPTLLIVGGSDPEVLELNKEALEKLNVEKKLEVVPGATHLFEEPGTLEEVARLAVDWFLKNLT